MHYYKSVELASIYAVSRRTVTNWIEATRNGRLDLDLHEESGKFYVSKTSKNQLLIKKLIQERRKFLNKRSLKLVTPQPEFYQLYSEDQILDIISNIDIHREIPRQYNYFNGGADAWDKFATELYFSETPNVMTRTIKLLENNSSYIEGLLDSYDQVNIIDVGVGNVLPIKAFLGRILKSGKLRRYVAIDISQQMLNIAKRNVETWFGKKVHFEGHLNDIRHMPFASIIAESPIQNPRVINVVLLLGGTLVNLRDPDDGLKTVAKSMGRNDIFIYACGLDSLRSRQHFSFAINKDKTRPIAPHHKFVVDLLGIEPSYYTAEAGFDELEKARFLRLRLKHALSLEFKLSKGDWQVELNRDDCLLLWRARHSNPFDLPRNLYENGFNPLLISQTTDHDYMMILADLRRDGR